ncbi:MAG: hypothetical protein HUU55_02085 [Myxococcales bacterium]|nr:hypothetical protein [Myxococcales bacterium]
MNGFTFAHIMTNVGKIKKHRSEGGNLRAKWYTWTVFIMSLSGAIQQCGTDEVACSSGADCASGVCSASGTCVQNASDSDGELSFGNDTSFSGDSTLSGDDQTSTNNEDSNARVSTGDSEGRKPTDVGTPSVCSPDNNGRIDRDEVPIAPELHATYRIAQNTSIDTAGDLQPDGSRVWNLADPLNADHDVLVEAQPLSDKWFADVFPGATYAAKLSETADLLGVFEATDTALLLRGVVSPTDGLLRTELVYDPPAALVQFPVQSGNSFESTSTVTGLTTGVVSFYTETYKSTVDASGLLKTPYANFPVLRIRVELTRIVGVLPTVTRSFLFLSECFGTVATITSKANELQEEFIFASEVRRLAP